MGNAFLSPAEFFADLANPALSFLPNALLMAVAGAVLCGIIGTHVTLRGMAFLGDAVAHAVFPGLAIAFALQVSVLLGGAVAGIVIAMLIAVFSQRRRVKEDTIIGIFFAAAFALGLVIIAQIDGYTASLTSFLFGSITGVARSDIYGVMLVGAVILAVLWLFHDRLVAVSLDRETARAMGLNVLALDMLLYIAVTMAVVMSVRTVGNILVLALLITPAATARLVTERLVTMMWLSALIGALGAAVGVYVSWAADVPTGATIVLILTAFFVLTYLLSPRHGVFGRHRRQRVHPEQEESNAAPGRGARARRAVGAMASAVALFGVGVLSPAGYGAPEAAAQEDGAPEAAQEEAARPQHKPGYASTNPTVPEGTIDPATGKTHVCAGKKLLYRAHVDALYGTYRDGQLAIMVVDGTSVVNPEDVCIRLGPDADADGKELSRLVVPDSPAFEFLGTPGDILWHAPQQVDSWGGWRPVWAGAGAFDPHHEYEVPKNFENNQVKFSLVGANKPGNMDMFFYSPSSDKSDVYLSTKNGPTHFNYTVGAHGHFGWTFSKAGRYEMTWQATAKTTDGQQLASEPTTITWLVGSDEEVGLPEGTTTGLEPITTTAEDIRDEQFPAGGETPAPDTQAPETGEPGENGPGESDAEEHEGGNAPGGNTGGGNAGGNQPGESVPESAERTTIRDGHMDLALVPNNGQGESPWQAVLFDGQDPSNVVRRPSGSFEFLIDSDAAHIPTPSVLRSTLSDGGKGFGDALWQIPQTQQEAPDVPWLGFNTEDADYSALTKDGVTVGLKEFEGPGRMITARGGIGQFDVLLDSSAMTGPGAGEIHYPYPTHDHQAFMFSAPGRYRAVFEFRAEAKDGTPLAQELEAFFSVAPNQDATGGASGNGEDHGAGQGDKPGTGAGLGNSGAGNMGGTVEGTAGDGAAGDGAAGPVGNEQNPEIVEIIGATNNIVSEMDTGLGHISSIIGSVLGLIGLGASEGTQPEVLPEVRPADASGDNTGNQTAGTSVGAGNSPSTGAAAHGGAEHGGTAHGGAAHAGTVHGGTKSTSEGGSGGAGAGASAGASASTGGLSSADAAPLALDSLAADGGEGEENDEAEDTEGLEEHGTEEGGTEDQAELLGDAAAGKGGASGKKAEAEASQSKAIQLANALGQGGWIGGLMFGMGAMALIGGIFFALIAWRLMRKVGAAPAEDQAEGTAGLD